MTGERTLPWILFPLSEKRHRAFSFRAAVENGFEPREYRSLLHDEKPMTAEALLDFKLWGKSPNLTYCFRNIRSREKFRLSAFDNKHDRRYTSRDGNIDFSESGIENGVYLVATAIGKRGGRCVWQSASLLLAPDRKDEILERIAETFSGQGG